MQLAFAHVLTGFARKLAHLAYDKEKVLAEMLHDKKAQGGQITIIKVPGLGCWRAETIPVEGLRPLLGMED